MSEPTHTVIMLSDKPGDWVSPRTQASALNSTFSKLNTQI